MEDFENSDEVILDLCYQSRLKKNLGVLATIIDRPIWESIEKGIHEVFRYGGFARITVMEPKNSFIRFFCMDALPEKFRLVAVVRSPKPKEDLFEWWESGDFPYKGTTRFGDDDWDSRTVCNDFSVAQLFFKDIFETGDLKESQLSQMRSPWNPKPR